MKIPLAALALLAVLTAPARADLYSWTDEKGATHYSSTPPKETKKRNVKTHKSLPTSAFEFKPSTSAASAREYAPLGPPVLASASRAAAPTPSYVAAPSVDLYSTASCGYCAQARAYLTEKRVAYTDHDVEHDEAAYQAFRNYGAVGVPFAVIGGAKISGFSPERYRQVLGLP